MIFILLASFLGPPLVLLLIAAACRLVQGVKIHSANPLIRTKLEIYGRMTDSGLVSGPRDAEVMEAILKEMGVSEYDPMVVHQMLEFVYRAL